MYECECVSLRVCMRVSPLHFVSIVPVGNKRFPEFEKKGYGRTHGWTNRQTDGRTDGRTDWRMDRPSYRDARTHLKTLSIDIGPIFLHRFIWKWQAFEYEYCYAPRQRTKSIDSVCTVPCRKSRAKMLRFHCVNCNALSISAALVLRLLWNLNWICSNECLRKLRNQIFILTCYDANYWG